ncbi:DUF4062 domain-containing protein [Accumulibacter sp.]|uniref:DUF4062 domain-containing protein n=1 Tax=Accumulibacter sp. TaxID=2053492 RepID=UPI002634CC67|nr:DUF4062 domain-containing protein [Accumulibacter sp.]
MPRATDIAKVSQVFLSATAQDCRLYREAVKAAVERNVKGGKVFLQRDWVAGGHFVVDVCQREVETCDAYMGLFGHRYGWIPPDHTRSITELEFRWATKRWPQRDVPIFILLPEKGSDADRQLREWALPYIENEYPDKESRDKATQAQQRFLQAVGDWASQGRMLTFYGNQQELTEKACFSIVNWNLLLLEEALAGRKQAKGEIPAHELGRIGREDQRTALSKAFEAFGERPGERAVAFLVHGAENHGQREFAEFLHGWEEQWEEHDEVHLGQPTDADSTGSLIGWACGQLQQPVLGAAAIEALAEVLAARLAHRNVVFVLRTAGRQRHRLATFVSDFWQPLRLALAAASPGGKGRLYWFVIDHEPLADDPEPLVRRAGLDADDVDYRHLLALPELAGITAQQLQRWLKELKSRAGITLDEERRREIASYATQPDGEPSKVYNRLVLEGFWASAN